MFSELQTFAFRCRQSTLCLQIIFTRSYTVKPVVLVFRFSVLATSKFLAEFVHRATVLVARNSPAFCIATMQVWHKRNRHYYQDCFVCAPCAPSVLLTGVRPLKPVICIANTHACAWRTRTCEIGWLVRVLVASPPSNCPPLPYQYPFDRDIVHKDREYWHGSIYWHLWLCGKSKWAAPIRDTLLLLEFSFWSTLKKIAVKFLSTNSKVGVPETGRSAASSLTDESIDQRFK